MKHKIATVLILSLALIMILAHSMIPHHHHDESAVKVSQKTHHHHHHGTADHHHHDDATPDEESNPHSHPPHHVHANVAVMLHSGQNLKTFAPRHFSHALNTELTVAATAPLLHRQASFLPDCDYSLSPALLLASGLRAPPTLLA